MKEPHNQRSGSVNIPKNFTSTYVASRHVMLTISPAQRPGDFEGDNSLISTANIRSPLLQVIAWQPVNPDLHVHLCCM